MNSVAAADLESARSETRGLMLTQLRRVVKAQRLPVSGPKATLQARIIDKLTDYAQHNDAAAFGRLRGLLSDPDSALELEPAQVPSAEASPQHLSKANPTVRSHSQRASSDAMSMHSQDRLKFKHSPFYNIQSSITTTHELKVRENTRDTFECVVRIPHPFTERFARGENLRVLIYCAPEQAITHSEVDIAFPSQIEIKVNGAEVKANLRGLKQRPGSTRPADITDLVHKKASFDNTLNVTYALTTKKYLLVVKIAEQIGPDELVNALKNRPRITKQQVLRDMATKAQDSEIQATSSVLSLKCPLSTLRMDDPCRSTACNHNQCYDALSYLQLQEQAPTWVCPVCNKPAPFETIQLDEYVGDILRTTTGSIEQVAIEPDGVWSQIEQNQAHGNQPSSEDDDDLIEISELPRLSTLKNEAASISMSARTPPQSSREQSTTSTLQRSGGQKRPAAIIDLTISDDEDQPPRAPKRRTTIHATSPASVNSVAGTKTFGSSSISPGLSFNISRPGGAYGRRDGV